MATKKNSPANWHKKHVPTKWGVAVLAFLLVATVILIPVLNKQQVSESEASTAVNSSTKCISYNTSGKCELYQTTTTTVNTKSPCVGYNTSGQCVQYQNSTQNQTTSTTSPKTATNGTTSTQTSQKKTTTTGKNYGQSSSCKNMGGNCESTNAHKNGSGGSYHAGICPGPSSWQCWIPSSNKTTGPKVGSTSGTDYLVCNNGKLIAVGGSAAMNKLSDLESGCAKTKNFIFVNGKSYTCSTIPQTYKSYTAGVCK